MRRGGGPEGESMRRGGGGAFSVAVSVLLAACGGGGGGGGGDVGYLTADVRSAGGAGAALANEGGGVAAPEAGAADAAIGIQREIEEADVARFDGSRLVLLNAYRGLVVVDLGAVEVLGRTPLSGFPQELFLRGSRALAFHGLWDGGTRLSVVSLDDPSAPEVETSFDLPGYYVGSRLVGDVLYAVTDSAVTSFAIGASV